MNTHKGVELWITPVEKHVENVENCELSTGISTPSQQGVSCGKLCIRRCILRCPGIGYGNYVTGSNGDKNYKRNGKSLQNVKNSETESLQNVTAWAKFVKN